MNFLERVNQWFLYNRSLLDQCELGTISHSIDKLPKRSVHVAVQQFENFAELIVWETGEVEFGYGMLTGSQSDEHLRISSSQELDKILERFLSQVIKISSLR